MKKAIVILLSILLLVGAVYLLLPKVRIKQGEKCVAHFGASETTVSEEDLREIKKMFNGKLLYRDNPSCGFSESVSIVIDGEMTFCFACDNCPFIYYKEKDKYFTLSEKNKDRLHEIMEKYGFHWPCV